MMLLQRLALHPATLDPILIMAPRLAWLAVLIAVTARMQILATTAPYP
jgi:hypothetical protein